MALCRCSGSDTKACEAECDESFPGVLEPPADANGEKSREELALLLNEVRAAGGCCTDECFEPLSALIAQTELTRAATWHAVDMAERGFIAHETPEGVDAVTRIRRAGYDGCAVGENISIGDDEPTRVVGDFLNSYEHCLNVFEPRFSEIGLALARDADDEPYWVVTFGGQ